MTYHSNKALERLAWRFSQGKAFTPNENDINALNTLINAFNEYSTTIQPTSQHFATLYVYAMNQLLQHYDTLPNSQVVQDELFEVINNGVTPQVEQMASIINSKLIDLATTKAGMSDKMPINRDEFDNELNLAAAKTIDAQELKEKQVDFNYVYQNIAQQINKVIEKLNEL